MKKGLGAAGVSWSSGCESAVLKRRLGVHQGFEVALLRGPRSQPPQGAESLMSGPSGLGTCPDGVIVCGEGSSAAPWRLFVESMAGGP